MTTIIDYGSGNIRAICNIYDVLDISYNVASSVEQIELADKIILPGVGAFDETISKLNENNFRATLDKKVLEEKIPILGICVGMQMLGNVSEEGTLKGLEWISGKVKLFDKEQIQGKPKLPHLGWNSIKITNENPLFKNIDETEGFYFVHSYYFECDDIKNVIATAEYGKSFHASINKENVYGVQFHPEKSHDNGIQLLKNFALL